MDFTFWIHFKQICLFLHFLNTFCHRRCHSLAALGANALPICSPPTPEANNLITHMARRSLLWSGRALPAGNGWMQLPSGLNLERQLRRAVTSALKRHLLEYSSVNDAKDVWQTEFEQSLLTLVL